MHPLILPFLILAFGVSLAYWIGYPWPWSAALAGDTFLDAAARTLPEGEPENFWRPEPPNYDEPRYWFLRFCVHPHEKVYEQWAYGASSVSAMSVLGDAVGGRFIVLQGEPISRPTAPRLDVKVFGEPAAAAEARADYQRSHVLVNARLALSEIQRAGLPPCRNHSPAHTAAEVTRARYIVPHAWLKLPGVFNDLRQLDAGEAVDVFVMRHVNGPARPLSEFL